MASWSSIPLFGLVGFLQLDALLLPSTNPQLHKEKILVSGFCFLTCPVVESCALDNLPFHGSKVGVVGLNFDFVVLSLTKHSSYLVYNAALFFSPVIQRQYREKYGYGAMIPVAANDAFSIHAVLMTLVVAFQGFIYERGSQKLSKTCTAITSAVLVVAVVCIIIAWPNNS